MLNVADNIGICHGCQHFAPRPGDVAACDLDNGSIVSHAEQGRCPLGLYVVQEAAEPSPRPSAPAVSKPQPRKSGCGCKSRK